MTAIREDYPWECLTACSGSRRGRAHINRPGRVMGARDGRLYRYFEHLSPRKSDATKRVRAALVNYSKNARDHTKRAMGAFSLASCTSMW